MAWLLSEIFVITLAAAIFGVLIGLGIGGAGANRRAAALLERYRKLRARVEGLEHALHGAETRAAARSVAEAAVRTDLEGRLVELDEAAAQYRARAEAAERRVRVMEAQEASSIAAVPEVNALGGRSCDASEADPETQDERTSIRLEGAPVPLIDAVRMGLSRGNAPTLRDGNGGTAPALLHRLDQGERPPSLAAPREGQADDLRRIKGIGPATRAFSMRSESITSTRLRI